MDQDRIDSPGPGPVKVVGQSEVRPMKVCLLKHPREAFGGQDRIDREWRDLGYTAPPDYSRAVKQYEAFVRLLEEAGVGLEFVPADERTGLDSVYIRDASTVTDRGLVLGRMGKSQRRGEPDALAEYCRRTGLPVAGAVSGEGLLEGGDVLWLDERTLAVGQGYRTNGEGIRQLRTLTEGLWDEFLVVPLPHGEGPAGVLHLMSLISPVDRKKAVIHSRLISVPFRQRLEERGFRLLELPEEEFGSLGGNILALRPGQCLVMEGNPRTRRLLEDEGIEVLAYSGEEISLKGAGGPTCLTRPLVRI